MDDTVVIALYRHGLTEANKQRAYLGWTDSPLCSSESKNIREEKSAYEHIFSSDLGRCVATSTRLFPNQEPIKLKHLREMNFGHWEGKNFLQLKDDVSYQRWLDAWQTATPPEGESFIDFTKRVDEGWSIAIQHMIEKGAVRAAFVTHGGVIRHLLTRFASSKKDFWEWQVPFAQGYELTFTLEGLRRGDTCILLQEVPLTVNPNGFVNNTE
ncbi:histidine phosphatase family protein [Cytobacillus purgationiresistens]|uniref:Alpha-ribazole phosphatase n=1 Tax=Cytobacillus purgationiresistens TaxID=863449 RepID=A0ABU0APU1_9BACI|nr:histidine phosphatase family protein [Cytobacillus purgationiresistens]MDQ0273235.1 alpha-ribazole phosphatase [Cytobacillus purgationiresistens]